MTAGTARTTLFERGHFDLRRRSQESNASLKAGRPQRIKSRPARLLSRLAPAVILLSASAVALVAARPAVAQNEPPAAPLPLPDSPGPTAAQLAGNAGGEAAASVAAHAIGSVLAAANRAPSAAPIINWYVRFTNGPQVKPLTPGEKAWLAVRNVVDPFNGVTILGDSAIAIGSNAHSPYGPGMRGFGRSVGVSYVQDMTGEFFNTFVVPSIVRQDPHYHRMPHASIPRRAGHAILQVVWTQGDNGKPMLNYANLVGSAIDDEISNLYVPARKTNLPASAERYGIGIASAPIDNFVSEFLPDVASRIHVQVLILQRIINQVAKTSDAP